MDCASSLVTVSSPFSILIEQKVRKLFSCTNFWKRAHRAKSVQENDPVQKKRKVAIKDDQPRATAVKRKAPAPKGAAKRAPARPKGVKKPAAAAKQPSAKQAAARPKEPAEPELPPILTTSTQVNSCGGLLCGPCSMSPTRNCPHCDAILTASSEHNLVGYSVHLKVSGELQGVSKLQLLVCFSAAESCLLAVYLGILVLPKQGNKSSPWDQQDLST